MPKPGPLFEMADRQEPSAESKSMPINVKAKVPAKNSRANMKKNASTRTTNSIDIRREETFKGRIALGWECRRNSFPAFFTAMMRRISLAPPLEEPAHAPLNIMMAVGIQNGAPHPT